MKLPGEACPLRHSKIIVVDGFFHTHFQTFSCV